jgi:hypothetical protein
MYQKKYYLDSGCHGEESKVQIHPSSPGEKRNQLSGHSDFHSNAGM